MNKREFAIQPLDSSGNIKIPAGIRQELGVNAEEPYEIGFDPISRCITLSPCIVKIGNELQMAVFQVEGTMFLFIQSCDDGWDYSIHDKSSMKLLDGGQLDISDMTICNAAKEICKMFDYSENTLTPLPSIFLDLFND